jgi:hypothetical protein
VGEVGEIVAGFGRGPPRDVAEHVVVPRQVQGVEIFDTDLEAVSRDGVGMVGEMNEPRPRRQQVVVQRFHHPGRAAVRVVVPDLTEQIPDPHRHPHLGVAGYLPRDTDGTDPQNSQKSHGRSLHPAGALIGLLRGERWLI